MGWEAIFSLALDPEKARTFSHSSRPRYENHGFLYSWVRAARTLKRGREGKDV